MLATIAYKTNPAQMMAFWAGVHSAFVIYPGKEPEANYFAGLASSTSDWAALHSDWTRVGADLGVALEKLNERASQESVKEPVEGN